jgi:hypothetical protein
MLISVVQSILFDFKESYKDLGRPKEVMNILFYISLVLAFTQKWDKLIYIAGLYVLVYIWHILKDGKWRNLMRERYKKEALNSQQNSKSL